MKANKTAAVKQILVDYNNYETRKVKFTTLYKKCFWDEYREQYRVIGKAHDYSY